MMDSVDAKEGSFEYVAKWTMRFGKHKGVVFSEVPVDYLKWCYKNGVIKNERVEGYLEELFGE
jgi:uncharacterized protein (DUF3820 family)